VGDGQVPTDPAGLDGTEQPSDEEKARRRGLYRLGYVWELGDDGLLRQRPVVPLDGKQDPKTGAWRYLDANGR